ncbi:MAG: ribosome biogenesis GTPase Der [Steroidobacteraceae bacterium]|jgi:GTP-binding protein|nr:ribosome biogenesis GTPase Der [Steroidobacteraceae bacterium]
MLPVIALVGRPNVGKSTLFNLLTGTRDALVADLPGLTRDRQYGYGRLGPGPYLVVDTGGLVADAHGLEQLMAKQTLRAIEEADRVLFLVDARDGLTPSDHYIAQQLRACAAKVIVAVNKAEGLDAATAAAEFHQLGFGEPHSISAAHGDGVRALMERALAGVQAQNETPAAGPEDISVAVIGRPNVGKSTLINRLLGEERLIAFDQPGTTRDAVYAPFERDGRRYVLIDTAGVRRRARVEEAIEKFSVIKALQAVDSANVVIGVIDAHDTVAEQDASLFGMVAERGRALVVAVNKWDGIPPEKRDEIRAGLDLRLPFLDFAPVHFISALHGSGVGELMRAVSRAYDASMRELPTPELTRVLEAAVRQHQPPLVRGRRIKLRYAHQGGRNPPIIVIHGNQVQHVPDAYRRYLANVFRKAFRLEGTPVRIEFRADENPFKGRRNELTPRQRRSRQRLMRRVKGRK